MDTPLEANMLGKEVGKRWQGQLHRMKAKLGDLYEDLKRDMYIVTLPNPADIGELSSASKKIITGDGISKNAIMYIRDCFLRDGIIAHPSDFKKNVMYIYEVRNTLLNVRSGIYRSTTKFANNFFVFAISKECLYTDIAQESIAEFFESLKVLSLREGVLPYFGIVHPPDPSDSESAIDIRICDKDSEIGDEYFTNDFALRLSNMKISISDLCKILFGRHDKTWLDRIVEGNVGSDEEPNISSPKDTQDKRKAELARTGFLSRLKTVTLVSVGPPESLLLSPSEQDVDTLEAFDLKFNFWTANIYRRSLIVNCERKLGEKGYRRITYSDGYSRRILTSFFSGNDKFNFPEVFPIDDK